jgi:hypothetical protein
LRPPPEELSKESLAAQEEAILKWRKLPWEPALLEGLAEADMTDANIQRLSMTLKDFVIIYPHHRATGRRRSGSEEKKDEWLKPGLIVFCQKLSYRFPVALLVGDSRGNTDNGLRLSPKRFFLLELPLLLLSTKRSSVFPPSFPQNIL